MSKKEEFEYTMTTLNFGAPDYEVDCNIEDYTTTDTLLKLQDELKKIKGYRFIIRSKIIVH